MSGTGSMPRRIAVAVQVDTWRLCREKTTQSNGYKQGAQCKFNKQTGRTFAQWHRPSGREDERPQCRTHTGRTARRASARVPGKTPSGANSCRRNSLVHEVHNPDWRGLDFDGKVLEVRSSCRPTACWRSWYAAALCWCLLSSMVFMTVRSGSGHLPPLSLSCRCRCCLVGAPFSSSLPCSCFSWGDGAARRTDAVTGPYPRYYSLEGAPCDLRVWH